MATLPAILTSKEQNTTPVLLATFTFADGSVLRASTHNLSSGEGGTAYGGNSYLARIAQQDIQQIQARSEQGIDRIGEVTLHLYNADQVILLNYEMAAGKGFKGAILKLVLVLMDIDPATGNYIFSSDSPAPVKFAGICEAPSDAPNGAATLTVRATTSHNLGKVDFPITHCQQRCINLFPATAAQRAAGASDRSSWWYGCGYNPDRAGPQCGNGSFTDCNYTVTDCKARGMYDRDSAGRETGRYKGIQWAPTNRSQQSRQYTSGKWITVASTRNDSIYDRAYPMLFGRQWVKKPIIANVIGDANSTRMEVVICEGQLEPYAVEQVVVNGVLVPPIGYVESEKLFRFNWLDSKYYDSTHTGGRNGIACADYGYNGQGDPYGGLATIEIVVPAELAQSNSTPDVKILAKGPKLPIPDTNDPADSPGWPFEWTRNPVWILLYLLTKSNWSYAEIDLQSFRDAAAVCDVMVSYETLTGDTSVHERFQAEFCLEDRRKANEVIQALLRSFRGQLVPNSESGLLQLFIRQTLAEQQPSAVAGSNSSAAIASIDAAGDAADGYPAYVIDESVIQRDESGELKVRGPYCAPTSQTPNRITIPFQDQANSYADDSIVITDTADVARAAGYMLGGQAIEAGLTILGPPNFDQAVRTGNVLLAENLSGNENGDSRGTRCWDVEVTHRLQHARVGHLVRFKLQHQQVDVLARIEVIKPTTNYRRMTLTLKTHRDLWYTDEFGQSATPPYSDPGKALPARLPYPWKPYGEQPITGDSIWPATAWGFGVAQSYAPAADGSPIAVLSISGCPPVNQFAPTLQPPLLAQQGTTANTGGTIVGGTRVYWAISVQDSDGLWSTLSQLGHTDVPIGTDTNTATTPTIYWPSGVAGWVLYGGTSEQTFCRQASATGTTPSTVTITSLAISTYGAPDPLADAILVRVKRIYHGGCWGDLCTAVASNGDGTGTITFATATTDDQFADYDLSKLANALGNTDNVPIADFRVSGHTAGVYTVSPDPVAAGVVAGDVFEMRPKPTATATTIGDANFANAYNGGTGFITNKEKGRRIRIRAGKGEGQERTIASNTGTVLTVDQAWDITPDATSRFVIEEATWQTAPSSKISAIAVTASPAPVVAQVDLSNYRMQTILVQALIADANGNTSLNRYSPVREIYIWGAQGTRVIDADTTQLVTDGLVLCDTSANSIVYQCLPAAEVPNQVVIWQKVTADANTVTIQAADGESFDDGNDTIVLTDNSANGKAMVKFHG